MSKLGIHPTINVLQETNLRFKQNLFTVPACRRALFVFLGSWMVIMARAQTTTYVALCTTNGLNGTYNPLPNTAISVLSPSTNKIYGIISGNTFQLNTGGFTYTGLTNIYIQGGAFGYCSLQVINFAPVNTISNCLPADCLVIPTSQMGPVMVTLESSSDLVNWTAATPGLYGPNTGTNRFFRVRAQAQ